jgi:hypothetical protein
MALAAVLSAATAAGAGAQTAVESNLAAHGTELGGTIAAAVTASETAPMVSGSAGWGLSRWVLVEARGAWFARGENTHGVNADVGAVVNLISKRQTTPYAGLAFGLYQETTSSSAAEVSPFYRKRMTEPAGRPGSQQTFTDPAWRISGGIDFVRHRNISIRPEASVVLVHRNGATDTITTIGVRLGYVFEDHPVTPSIR